MLREQLLQTQLPTVPVPALNPRLDVLLLLPLHVGYPGVHSPVLKTVVLMRSLPLHTLAAAKRPSYARRAGGITSSANQRAYAIQPSDTQRPPPHNTPPTLRTPPPQEDQLRLPHTFEWLLVIAHSITLKGLKAHPTEVLTSIRTLTPCVVQRLRTPILGRQ